jgi:hypothetical protein
VKIIKLSYGILLAVALTLPLASTWAGAQKTSSASPSQALTVDGVISMAQAGLSDDVIVARLRKDGKAFDLSAEDMIRLKQGKVSDPVVKVMLDPKADPSSAAATLAPAATPYPGAAPRPAGAMAPHGAGTSLGHSAAPGGAPAMAAPAASATPSPATSGPAQVAFDNSGLPTVSRTDGVTVAFADAQVRIAGYQGMNYIVRYEKASAGRTLRNAFAPSHVGTGIAGEGQQFLIDGGGMLFDSALQGVNAANGRYGMDKNLLLPKQLSQVIVDAVASVNGVAGHESFKPKGYGALKEVSQYRLKADGSQH